MKKLLFAFVALSLFACSSDDSTPVDPNNGNPNPENPNPVEVCDKVFKGTLWLKTQADVDAFLEQNYCKIIGNVRFGDADIEASALITDVSGFSDIEIKSEWVVINRTNLTSLNGLQHIQGVSRLHVIINPGLTNLENSPEVTAVGEAYIYGNVGLVSTQGLVLQNSCELLLFENTALETIAIGGNFDRLKKLGVSSSKLTTLEGLENVKKIGVLSISDNPNIVSLKGLENVAGIVYLGLSSNASLTTLEHLHSITSIEAMSFFPDANPYFFIHDNNSLESLAGLENVATYSGGTIYISENTALTDFCAIRTMLNNSPSLMSFNIQNNAYNPHHSIIKSANGNCSQP